MVDVKEIIESHIEEVINLIISAFKENNLLAPNYKEDILKLQINDAVDFINNFELDIVNINKISELYSILHVNNYMATSIMYDIVQQRKIIMDCIKFTVLLYK